VATPLVIACGALAGELRAVLAASGLADGVEVRYLPANLHNRPERIVPALREQLGDVDVRDRPVLIAYADCGTGGLLDAYLDELPGVRRLPGAHCYETFAGAELFASLHDAEPGTLYLTDFLARHFEAIVIRGLGLDRHPELLSQYFGNYRRLLYLAQTDDDDLRARARAAAERLGLEYEERRTGYGDLVPSLTRFVEAPPAA